MRVTWVQRKAGWKRIPFQLVFVSLDRPVLADFDMGSGPFCRLVARTAYLLYSLCTRAPFAFIAHWPRGRNRWFSGSRPGTFHNPVTDELPAT